MPAGADRWRLPPVRRRGARPAGVHRPGQAARLHTRGDHRSRRHLGRTTVRRRCSAASTSWSPRRSATPSAQSRRARRRSPHSCGRQPSGSPANPSTGRAADCACLATASAMPVVQRHDRAGRNRPASPSTSPSLTLEPAAMPGPARRVGPRAGLRDRSHGDRRRDAHRLRCRDVDMGELGRLIGAEQHCCAFFSLHPHRRRRCNGARSRPQIAADLIVDLFGRST